MHRRIGHPVVIALLLAGVSAAPAWALEPGVFVDPNSPAGKEYAYPLGVLRSQGAGKATAVPGAPQPLFGVGVGAARTSGSGNQGLGRATGRHGPASRANQVGGMGAGRGRVSSSQGGVSQAGLLRLAKPGSALPMVALIALLVLMFGGGGGTLLSRLRRSG